MKKTVKLAMLCLIIGMSAIKCKKDKVEQLAKVVCTLSDSTAAPFQMVMVNSSTDAFTDDIYTGTLGDSSIKLTKVSANQLAFMVPPKTTIGDKTLQFNLPSNNVSLSITIIAPTVILTAPSVITSIDAALNDIKTLKGNADSLIASGKYNKADLDFLKALNDSMLACKTRFSNASPEVQKYALLFMATNASSINELNKIGGEYGGMGLNKTALEWMSGLGKISADLTGRILCSTILGYVAITAIPPAVVGSLGVASALTLGTMLGWEVDQTRFYAGLAKIKELIAVANNKTEIPTDMTVSVDQFEANVETPVSSDITYRSIAQTDETSNSTMLSGYVKNIWKVRNEWRRNVISKLGDLKDFVSKKVVGKPKSQAQLKAVVVDHPDATVEVKGTPDKYTLTIKTTNLQLKDVNLKITYEEKIGDATINTVDKVIAVKIGSKCSVTAGEATAIGYNDATIPVSIVTGGLAITNRGVCYGSSHAPTIGNSKYVTFGSGPGNFSAQITNLNAGTTYYARAFAVTSSGGNYGNEVSFKTLSTKDLLFRKGWRVVSVTHTTTIGLLSSIEETVFPNLHGYDTCGGGKIIANNNRGDDGTGGLSFDYTDSWLKIIMNCAYAYTWGINNDCSSGKISTHYIKGSPFILTGWHLNYYDETTKTYTPTDGYGTIDPLIYGKVLQISNTSAILEDHTYWNNGYWTSKDKYIINLAY